MVRHDVDQTVKPEAGHLGQDPSLARYALVQHDIKGRDPVGCDDQQMLVGFVNITDFSAAGLRESLDTRCQDNGFAHDAVFSLPDKYNTIKTDTVVILAD